MRAIMTAYALPGYCQPLITSISGGCWICRHCRASPRTVLGGLEENDFGDTVGNLHFVYTAVCRNAVRRLDMGLAQGSTHQFDANRSDRGTCCRRARSGRLRLSLT